MGWQVIESRGGWRGLSQSYRANELSLGFFERTIEKLTRDTLNAIENGSENVVLLQSRKTKELGSDLNSWNKVLQKVQEAESEPEL